MDIEQDLTIRLINWYQEKEEEILLNVLTRMGINVKDTDSKNRVKLLREVNSSDYYVLIDNIKIGIMQFTFPTSEINGSINFKWLIDIESAAKIATASNAEN